MSSKFLIIFPPFGFLPRFLGGGLSIFFSFLGFLPRFFPGFLSFVFLYTILMVFNLNTFFNLYLVESR